MNTIYQRMSDLQLTVHCRRCDRSSKHRIAALLAHRKFVCPACASLNDVDTASLEQKISTAQQKHDATKSASPAPVA